MAITVSCDCGGRFRVGDQHAGKKIKCPKCSGAVQVPDAAEDAPEPVAVPKARSSRRKRKPQSSGSVKAISEFRSEEGTDRPAPDEGHRGDTVRLETAKIEVLSQRSVTSRRKKEEVGAPPKGDEMKKVMILVGVIVVLLGISIVVGVKIFSEPTGRPVAVENPPPAPVPPTRAPTPVVVDPTPVEPPPAETTLPAPTPSVPAEPETLDGLAWTPADFGGVLPERVRRSASIKFGGSITEETSGKTRAYDVAYDWEGGAIVCVDGSFDDREGNKLTLKELTFYTSKDKAAIEAAAAKGLYSVREGGVKSGTVVVSYANQRGSLTVAFQDGRVTQATGVAPTCDGGFQDVDRLRVDHLAVSTLSGLLAEVAAEIRDTGLLLAERKE